jgi:hypothetical protein
MEKESAIVNFSESKEGKYDFLTKSSPKEDHF